MKQLLDVKCQCGHRAVFSPEEMVNMTNVAEMASSSISCARCCCLCCLCGTKGAEGEILNGVEAATDWLAEASR